MDDWTLLEKRILLETLQEFGTENVYKISSKIPAKSVEAVQSAIEYYRNVAKQRVEEGRERKYPKKNVLNPSYSVDTYVDALRERLSPQQLETEVAHAFQYISKNELHPPPLQTKEIDFKVLYEVIACVLAGKQPPHLSVGNFLYLQKSLQSMDAVVKANVNDDILLHMKRFDSLSVGAEKGVIGADEYSKTVLQVRNNQKLNPFNVPFALLKNAKDNDAIMKKT